MDTRFSCRKNAFFPGVHKIGAAISGPRIADTNFTDTRIFLIKLSWRVMWCLQHVSKERGIVVLGLSGSPKPHTSKPHPCNMPQAKTEIALQFSECCINIRFSAVRKWFLPKAALQQAKNCSATLKKLRCRKVALSVRFPADFKPPRLLSWHVCRVNFARKILFELRIFLRKMLRNFPQNFWAFVPEKSRKIPSKFPTKFSKFPCEKSKKKSPTSFCRSAGRNV